MNRIGAETQTLILHRLVGGAGIRDAAQIASVSKNTVANFLVRAGRACAVYQQRVLHNANCEQVEVRRVWSFTTGIRMNATAPHKAVDIWTHAAICAETKLAASWAVSDRRELDALDLILSGGGHVSINLEYKPKFAVAPAHRTPQGRMAITKRIDAHICAVALHFMFYNFCRIHPSLNLTPAMAAGLASCCWGLNDIIRIVDQSAVTD